MEVLTFFESPMKDIKTVLMMVDKWKLLEILIYIFTKPLKNQVCPTIYQKLKVEEIDLCFS